MFKPTYHITDYFLELIEQIARLSAEIEAKNIKLPLMVKLKTEALAHNVHS